MVGGSMRALLAATLALHLASFAAVAAAEGGDKGTEDDEDDFPEDDDLNDFDADLTDDFDVGGGPGAGEPVVDADKDLSPDQRTRYMSACYSIIMNLVAKRRDMVEQRLDEVMKVQPPHVTRDMAANSVVVSWMMQCYLNMDDSRLPGPGVPITEDHASAALQPREEVKQQPSQASERQWALLKAVATERQKLEMEAQRQQSAQAGAGASGGGSKAGTPTGQAPMSDMPGSRSTGFLYALAVFTVIFGIAALAVMKLSKPAVGGERERSSKSNRKADKAERMLAKKRF